MSARWVRDMPPDFAATWAKYDLLERLPEEVWNHLADQITRALTRLRYRVHKTLDRIRTEHVECPRGRKDNLSCNNVTTVNGEFHKSISRDYLFVDALEEVGIWPTFYPFQELSVNKAVGLLNEALQIAEHECDHYRDATTDRRCHCPLLFAMDSLSEGADRVQGGMKGFERSTARQEPEEADDDVVALDWDSCMEKEPD